MFLFFFLGLGSSGLSLGQHCSDLVGDLGVLCLDLLQNGVNLALVVQIDLKKGHSKMTSRKFQQKRENLIKKFKVQKATFPKADLRKYSGGLNTRRPIFRPETSDSLNF